MKEDRSLRSERLLSLGYKHFDKGYYFQYDPGSTLTVVRGADGGEKQIDLSMTAWNEADVDDQTVLERARILRKDRDISWR